MFKGIKSAPEKEMLKGIGPGEKEQLFDLLVHDLTSPLSIVSASAHNLLKKAHQYGPLTEKQAHVIERILRNVHKAQTLLQEMIEISSSEEGLFKKEFFPIHKILKESLIDVLEASAPQAVEKICQTEDQEDLQAILKPQGIFIEMTGRYCETPFCHDSNKIRQILRNLMSNAMKYRRERMRVSIGGDLDLFISVEDDGIGIRSEDQETIFKRFTRLNDKRRPDVPGYGLGLSGVKSLVAAMDGQITLKSHEESGTCFTVRIPPLQS